MNEGKTIWRGRNAEKRTPEWACKMAAKCRSRAKLEDYDISPSMGFVPEIRLERLPEYFSPWENLCDDIPQMVKDGTTRSRIDKLPLLDHCLLSSKEEWYRAQLVLTDLASCYVWCQGEKGAVKVLPKNISIPLVGVARHLDMPPIVTHFSQANCNWRKIGPDERDIELINTFTGTKAEEGFFKTAIGVELAFGKGGPQAVIDAQQAALDDDVHQLVDALTVLTRVIHEVTSAFLKVHEVCDPREFYCLLRPFLTGWDEGSALVDGLVYEGVDTKPMKYPGASAAQCSAFQVIDALLGIKHKTTNGEKHFLDKMRQHMPPKHRAFISAIENGPSVKAYVLQKNSNHLTEKYNQCVEEIQEFRNVHVRVVVKYIVSQAHKHPKNMNKKLAERGTGGSDLLPFLKKIRSETEEVKFKSK